MVKHTQFEGITGTNTDLQALQTLTNLAKHQTSVRYYFCQGSSDGSTDIQLLINYVDLLTGSTILLENYHITPALGTDLGYSSVNIMLDEADSSVIYATITYYYTTLGSRKFRTDVRYSVDSGSSWNTTQLFSSTGDDAMYSSRCSAVDTSIVLAYSIVITAVAYLRMRDLTTGFADDVALTNPQSFYQGLEYDDEYYSVIYSAAGDYELISFNIGTHTITVEETLVGIDTPDTFNASKQIYWRQDDYEYLIDLDHFYIRKIGTVDWGSIAAEGSALVGIIWGYDVNGKLKIVYVVFRDGFFKILDRGAVGKIQDTFPRDYKKIFGHPFDDLPGVIQWQTDVNPDFSLLPPRSGFEPEIKEIVAEIGGSKYVLHLKETGLSHGQILYTITESGTVIIEARMYPTESVGSDAMYISGVNDPISATRCGFWLEGGRIYNLNGGATNDTGETYTDNTFITLRSEYVSGITNKLYLNGNLIYTEGTPTSGTVEGLLIGVIDTNGYFDSIGIVAEDYVEDSNQPIKATVGWEDWIANGVETIYQADDLTLENVRETPIRGCARRLYIPNYFELICQTEPFEEQFVILKTDDLELLIQDFISEYESTSQEFRWLIGNHPDLLEPAGAHFTDLNQDVAESYTDKTAHYILKDIIDKYCSFYWYDAGISTTPATTYTITFGKKVLDVFKWADARNGYQVSWRASFEIYWDLYTEHAWDYKRTPNTVQIGTAANPSLGDWTDISGVGCTVTVAAEKNGHKNPLMLDDQSAATQCRTTLPFTAGEGNGFREMWFLITDSSKIGRIFIEDGGTSNMIWFYNSGGNFLYWDGSGHVIVAVASNIGYQLKFDWRCTGAAAYEGLAEGKWQIKITPDGSTATTYGPFDFQGTPTEIDRIEFQTINPHEGYQMYIDGLSTDGYTAGSNQEQIADFSMVAIPEMKPLKKKYGRFFITGGFYMGQLLTSEKTINPNFATYVDEFPEEKEGIHVGDDGRYHSTSLDNLRDQLITSKSTAIQKFRAPMIDVGWLNPGQQVTITNGQFSLSKEVFYVVESKLDELNKECLGILTNALWQPPIKDSQKVINNNQLQQNANIEKKTTWTQREDFTVPDLDDTDLAAAGDDTDFHSHDISALVGASRQLIYARCLVTDGVADSALSMRTPGDTSTDCTCVARSILAGKEALGGFFGYTDENGHIEIASDPKPSSWTLIIIAFKVYRDA